MTTDNYERTVLNGHTRWTLQNYRILVRDFLAVIIIISYRAQNINGKTFPLHLCQYQVKYTGLCRFALMPLRQKGVGFICSVSFCSYIPRHLMQGSPLAKRWADIRVSQLYFSLPFLYARLG